MCTAEQKDFATNPKAFMERHLVVVPKEINTKIVGRGYTLAEFYIEMDNTSGVFILNTTIGVSNRPKHYVIAYWCPYEKDGTGKIVVGNYADYMFTAKLDGCTFGVGRPTDHGEVLVCHANRSAAGNKYASEGIPAATAAVKKAQLKGVQKALGKGEITGLLETDIKHWATVIGVSTPWGKWDFYYQDYSGNKFEGLKPFSMPLL